MPNIGMNVAGPGIDEYETPSWLFKALDGEFGFTFDAAASESNRLCKDWTSDIVQANASGLIKPTDRVWCNPPYSSIPLFVDIALQTRLTKWVFLLPTRTGTDWFKLLYDLHTDRREFRFFRKRIDFMLNGGPILNPKTGKPQGPRFDSMIVILRGRG